MTILFDTDYAPDFAYAYVSLAWVQTLAVF